MIFFRILNNTLYSVGEVSTLGWSKENPMAIPTEYLDDQIFTIFRTCFGIGDWGILSAMPRLLKQKYPNCFVQLPSEKLQRKIFNLLEFDSAWTESWSNPFMNMEYVFRNNPYVDAFVDYIEGEVYTDHFRIFNKSFPNTPLLHEILKFWQFAPEEYEDSSPELYFSEEEQLFGDAIISEFGNEGFGTLLLSNRFEKDRDWKFINTILLNNPLPYFYYSRDVSNLALFEFNRAFDLNHVPIRIQLYIKTQSNIIVGNQSGMDIMFPRYTDTYMMPKGKSLSSNIVKGKLHINA